MTYRDRHRFMVIEQERLLAAVTEWSGDTTTPGTLPRLLDRALDYADAVRALAGTERKR